MSQSYFAVSKEDFDKLVGGSAGFASKKEALSSFGDLAEGQTAVVIQKAYEVTREAPKPVVTAGLKIKSTRSSGPRGPRKKKEGTAEAPANETAAVSETAAAASDSSASTDTAAASTTETNAPAASEPKTSKRTRT